MFLHPWVMKPTLNLPPPDPLSAAAMSLSDAVMHLVATRVAAAAVACALESLLRRLRPPNGALPDPERVLGIVAEKAHARGDLDLDARDALRGISRYLAEEVRQWSGMPKGFKADLGRLWYAVTFGDMSKLQIKAAVLNAVRDGRTDALDVLLKRYPESTLSNALRHSVLLNRLDMVAYVADRAGRCAFELDYDYACCTVVSRGDRDSEVYSHEDADMLRALAELMRKADASGRLIDDCKVCFEAAMSLNTPMLDLALWLGFRFRVDEIERVEDFLDEMESHSGSDLRPLFSNRVHAMGRRLEELFHDMEYDVDEEDEEDE